MVTSCDYLILAHTDEVLKTELLVGHGVVGICIEHDESEGKQIGAVRGLEGTWVVLAVPLCKALHDAVNLLCFTCDSANCC